MRHRRGDLTDAEWERLRPFLPVSNRRCGRRDHRQVIDQILHQVRTGVHWRDLPHGSARGRRSMKGPVVVKLRRTDA
ncbi:transposase [Streptomyces collinus]|uniref:transposase n=1 Tax=Streptomyces collinus TaxID=42684 RepID=UPI0036BE9F69